VLVQLCWQEVQEPLQLVTAAVQIAGQGLQLLSDVGRRRVRGREDAAAQAAQTSQQKT